MEDNTRNPARHKDAAGGNLLEARFSLMSDSAELGAVQVDRS